MSLSFPTLYATATSLAAALLLLVNDSEKLPSVGSEGGPMRALSSDETKTWLGGRRLFERTWVESDGLGAPGFNAESCGTCHNAPTVGGAGSNEFNVIRGRGMLPYKPGQQRGNQLDRVRAKREQEREMVADLGGHPRHADRSFIERQTPSLFGLGLISTIPDEEIFRREDPDDTDRDGIRGVARRVTVSCDNKEIGRFGWKSQTPRLADFVCLALGGETGLTAPDQGRGFGLTEDRDQVSDPEISQAELDGLIFFVSNLAPPKRTGRAHENDVRLGEKLFMGMGCATCHVPTLQGSEGPVNLYSDLLLHEVIPEPRCKPKPGWQPIDEPEPTGFPTPPLWGASKAAPYMHDGSANTLRDAILAHHGEAVRAREQFEFLDEPDQCAVIMFLEDL